MNTKTYCVYSHTNNTNGKVYIGQTCDKIGRFYDGKYKGCKYFYKALQKYGGLKHGFTTVILEDNLTKEDADLAEMRYIAQFSSTDPKFGYNISDGGSGVKAQHTEEWKIEHSARMLGDNNPNYGKHWDATHKKNFAEKHRGTTRKREQWEINKIRETHQKMSHYNDQRVKCVNTGEIFNSQRECARVLSERTGIVFRGFEIGYVCKGKYQQTHGYKFEYVVE